MCQSRLHWRRVIWTFFWFGSEETAKKLSQENLNITEHKSKNNWIDSRSQIQCRKYKNLYISICSLKNSVWSEAILDHMGHMILAIWTIWYRPYDMDHMIWFRFIWFWPFRSCPCSIFDKSNWHNMGHMIWERSLLLIWIISCSKKYVSGSFGHPKTQKTDGLPRSRGPMKLQVN